MPPCPPLNPSPPKCPLVPRLNPKGLSNIWNRETSQHMPPGPPLNPSPPKCPLVPRLNPKGLSNIWNRETSQHMPPCPPLNPSPPKCPLVPRLNPKGLSIWNRETSQHMPPCPPLNPSPPKSPLVPRLNPKGLSNIFKLLLFRGECDPFWFRGECDPLLGANVTPVPLVPLDLLAQLHHGLQMPTLLIPLHQGNDFMMTTKKGKRVRHAGHMSAMQPFPRKPKSSHVSCAARSRTISPFLRGV